MSAREHLKQWAESEPERLDAAAQRWEGQTKATHGKNLFWLAAMAAEARKAAANLRAMRAARMRLEANGG